MGFKSSETVGIQLAVYVKLSISKIQCLFVTFWLHSIISYSLPYSLFYDDLNNKNIIRVNQTEQLTYKLDLFLINHNINVLFSFIKNLDKAMERQVWNLIKKNKNIIFIEVKNYITELLIIKSELSQIKQYYLTLLITLLNPT